MEEFKVIPNQPYPEDIQYWLGIVDNTTRQTEYKNEIKKKKK